MYDDTELEERQDKPEPKPISVDFTLVDSDDGGSLLSPLRSAERSMSTGSMTTAGKTKLFD